MKENKTYRIYHLKEMPLDNLIKMYETYAYQQNLHKHQHLKIKEGIEMLIHFIAQKQLSRYDNDKEELGVAEINYDIADKVIGDVFQDVKSFLVDNSIIKKVKGYTNGNKSNSYIINKEYSINPYYTNQVYPEKYYRRLSKAIDEYNKKQAIKEKKDLSKQEITFRKIYLKNLNKVEVIDKEGLKEYIDDYNYAYKQDIFFKRTKRIKHMKGDINEDKKLSYQIAYETYIEKKHTIYKWDEYGRIHHFITNSPRGFRDYLNIWFHIDVHNCQPLLFSTIIYNYFNISNRVREFISTSLIESFKSITDYNETIIFGYIDNRFVYHYETRNEDKNANNNDLQSIKNEISLIPLDVLEYLYLVMSGTLWDVLASLFSMERDEVKGTMFAELFYSNAKGVMPWQEHGKIFRKRFPNVTKAIISERNSHEKSWLPKEMQRRESKIMRKVLWSLMQQGFDVISIHDAILMLDTDNNRSRERLDEWGFEECNVQQDVELELQLAYVEEGMGCAVGW